MCGTSGQKSKKNNPPKNIKKLLQLSGDHFFFAAFVFFVGKEKTERCSVEEVCTTKP